MLRSVTHGLKVLPWHHAAPEVLMTGMHNEHGASSVRKAKVSHQGAGWKLTRVFKKVLGELELARRPMQATWRNLLLDNACATPSSASRCSVVQDANLVKPPSAYDL
jgi:hypothetical protein